MSKNRFLAAAAPFAHLLGLGPRAEDKDPPPAQSSAEDEDKRRENESEEDYKKRMDEKKAKKKAEDKKKEEEAAQAEQEEEDSDGTEMRGDAPAAKARARERRRCRAIFAHAAAAGRPDLAASLAFDTLMSRGEAIAVLETATAGAPRGRTALGDRMNALRVPEAGPGGPEAPEPGSPEANAAAILAAGRRARGEKAEAA